MRALFTLVVSWWCQILHFCWSLGIYLVTLVFSTFWVQDIFDFLMAEKLKDMKAAALQKGDKEAIKIIKQLDLIKFQPMTTTQLLGDLVARTVVIAVFLTMSGLL